MSPAITSAQSIQEAHALTAAIDAAARRGDWARVIEVCREALAHPCAHHAFYVPDLWTGLAEAYAQQESYEEAIAALESAVATGHRSWPHPDADLARLHLLAGRRGQGDALFDSLCERTPDDVWFRHAAGLAYADIDDHETAVAWFAEGIELAMRTGDPDGLVVEMDKVRTVSLRRLGREPDQLSERAMEFGRSWVKPEVGSWSPPAWPSDLPALAAEQVSCEHCGWRPAGSGADAATEGASENAPPPPMPLGTKGPIGVAWFTSVDWSGAIARWPHLLDEMPAEHRGYVRELQARLLEMSEAMGARAVMVPISIEGLLAYCTGEGKVDPGSGRARADFAATLLKQGHGRLWPPERNEPCWCGSGTKYKSCCGSVVLSRPR